MFVNSYSVYSVKVIDYKKVYKGLSNTNILNDETCSICLNSLDNTGLKTSCNHLFHYTCFNDYKKYIFNNHVDQTKFHLKNIKCPNCRCVLSYELYKIVLTINFTKTLQTEFTIICQAKEFGIYHPFFINTFKLLNMLDHNEKLINKKTNTSNFVYIILKISDLISVVQRKLYRKDIFECYTIVKDKKEKKYKHVDNENNIYIGFNNIYTKLYQKHVLKNNFFKNIL